MRIRSGTQCIRGLNHRGFDLTEIVVVERPRHGRVELFDRGKGLILYKPKDGFRGVDEFKIRFIGNRVDVRTGALLEKNASLSIAYRAEMY